MKHILYGFIRVKLINASQEVLKMSLALNELELAALHQNSNAPQLK
jgi:hypothetical protein